jgi:hypothetical protein
MPFIAIAAIIALCLGGGVTVAADHAQPGEALYTYKTHINDQVRHEYHAIKASLNLEADVDANAEASGDTHLAGEDVGNSDDGAAGGASVDAHGALRVRDDASTSTKELDNEVEGGAVHVNIY